MKVLDKQGKEVKNAQVVYDVSGNPVHVRVEGVAFAADQYKFEDDEPVKKTRKTEATKTTAAKNDSVMTTEDVK
jgi:hypothetical protein